MENVKEEATHAIGEPCFFTMTQSISSWTVTSAQLIDFSTHFVPFSPDFSFPVWNLPAHLREKKAALYRGIHTHHMNRVVARYPIIQVDCPIILVVGRFFFDCLEGSQRIEANACSSQLRCGSQRTRRECSCCYRHGQACGWLRVCQIICAKNLPM